MHDTVFEKYSYINYPARKFCFTVLPFAEISLKISVGAELLAKFCSPRFGPRDHMIFNISTTKFEVTCDRVGDFFGPAAVDADI